MYYLCYFRDVVRNTCINSRTRYSMGPFINERGSSLGGSKGNEGILIINTNITNLATTRLLSHENFSIAILRGSSRPNKRVGLTSGPPRGNGLR